MTSTRERHLVLAIRRLRAHYGQGSDRFHELADPYRLALYDAGIDPFGHGIRGASDTCYNVR